MKEIATVPGLVSIIMPFLNTPETFLSEAIKSVQTQSYDDWELILIDDGSRRIVSDVARKFADKHPSKIHYLNHDEHRNLGISTSRNLGLTLAKGEYIAFLDSDDVWLENKLQEQIALFERHPEAGMLYGNSLYWYGWTGKSADAQRDFQPRLRLRTPQLVEPPDMLKLTLQGRNIPPCMCSIIVRRDVLEGRNPFEDEFKGMYEDQIFCAKTWTNHSVYVVDQCWDKYRQHPESMTAGSDKSPPHRTARLKYLRWLSVYLTENNFRGTPVWHALTLELRAQQSELLGPLIRKCRRVFWRVFSIFDAT